MPQIQINVAQKWVKRHYLEQHSAANMQSAVTTLQKQKWQSL